MYGPSFLPRSDPGSLPECGTMRRLGLRHRAASETDKGGAGLGEERYQGDDEFLEWQKERARRVEKNEQAFRAYNERREEFEKDGLLAGESAPFVCECADTDCWASVDLTVDEFEKAHDTDDHYSVLPGHVMPEFERVVEKHERHWIVEKFTPQEVEERLVTDAKTQ